MLMAAGVTGLLAVGGTALLGRRGARASAASEDDICIVAPTFAHDPATGRAPGAPRAVPPQARCPVCGMFPARYPRWAAQVIFANGDVQYIDSPLNLFLYLQQVPRYTAGQSTASIVAAYVTDLDTGAWIPADQAWYVHGSRQMGPMRSGNLPAFATLDQARAFAAREGGEWLTAEVLRKGLPASLQQLAPHTHG
ncbi:MAG: hypothetical protein C0443_00625 [Comamonadaceae bacterium]|nr:hypothetical protein [Comamonadaceae bacterium]